MKTNILWRFLALISLCICSSAWAQAVPAPFQFSFCSADNQATAAGYITFDLNQMTNPFDNTDDGGAFYASAVLDLQVTVAGASSGNGTYTRDDFSDIAWDSNGGAINFSEEWVGQPTNGLPWGTSLTSGEAGDFNLFMSETATTGTPNGVFYFLLGADEGQAEEMSLRTFAPGPAEIPAPSCPDALTPQSNKIPTLSRWGSALLMLALLGLAAVGFRRLRA